MTETLVEMREWLIRGETIADDQAEYGLTTFVRADDVHEIIRAYLVANGLPVPAPATEDPAPHTHTDDCMCEMYDLEVIGARECTHCGGHDGGPCGSRCAVAYDEIVKHADPAPRDSAWTDFEWPTWVPADTRSEIERFWGAKQHRNPSAWQRNSHHNHAPHLGQVVTLPALGLGKPDMRTGRFVFCWNNIGRLVHDDGSRTCVSFGDNWATTQPTPASREPRVWQAGDDEPEGVDLVHDIDAADQDELVYARRMPDGLWRWLFTIDEEVGKRGDMPWQNLFGVATGRLAEVLSSALPTPGGEQ